MNASIGRQRNFNLMDPGNRGVLRLDLVERLPASDFSGMIAAINDVYFNHLWLGLAETTVVPRSMPDYYAPKDREKLYVKRLEVGTPNMVELIGLAQHVLPTFATVAGALGATKAAAALIHEIASARQAFATARKTDIETELLKFDLNKKASELLAKGKITAEQAEHKFAMEQESQAFLQEVLPIYAHNPQFWLEPAPVPSLTLSPSNTSDSASEPSQPIRLPQSDAVARLRALAGPGKESIVQKLIQACETATVRRDAGSLARLKAAKQEFTRLAGISERHLDSILGSDT